jgi:hypothetical protein
MQHTAKDVAHLEAASSVDMVGSAEDDLHVVILQVVLFGLTIF